MRVSRNSLLVRMVFYNDIAIVISSITIALFDIYSISKSGI